MTDKKDLTNSMREQIGKLTAICDDLLDDKETKTKELGAAMRDLVLNLGEYITKSASKDGLEDLMRLEIDGIKQQNSNMLTLISIAVGIIKTVPAFKNNTEVVKFLESAEKYVVFKAENN